MPSSSEALEPPGVEARPTEDRDHVAVLEESLAVRALLRLMEALEGRVLPATAPQPCSTQ
jgi:hypothetical protein